MPQYHEYEVSLHEIEPRIWRRFQIPRAASFAKLHEAIQDACGWTNSHLYEFRESAGEAVIAGLPDEELELDSPDARQVKTASTFRKPGDICLYVYDMGDYWEHEVRLLAIRDVPETFKRKLLAGERSFPPEDCGGVFGYWQCVAALGLPGIPDDVPPFEREEVAEARANLGDWRPDSFDLAKTRTKFDR